MIATAVSELVRNIIKYAGSGEIRLRRVKKMGARGIEIEALDNGPGIADCEAAMQDHYSSSGTLGLGLPAVKRMMDDFSLESTPGEGTRVTARKWIV
jgi:serine/threonine-protein kinase RsbT